MAKVRRRSDVIELHSERALLFGVCSLISLIGGIVLFRYRGAGYLTGLALVMITAGLIGLGYAIYCAWQVKKVHQFDVSCPYCQEVNALTEPPAADFTCVGCNRFIPIMDSQVMEVMQVRCGFCNTLNYYSEKTEVLLCENCNRDIPISTSAEGPTKKSFFAVVDDESMYELTLVAGNPHKVEELINSLQHMLALNRNQVKQMMEDLPVTLLQGINRRKGEMLQAQLAASGGDAELRAMKDPNA